jgi:hypothetical protein
MPDWMVPEVYLFFWDLTSARGVARHFVESVFCQLLPLTIILPVTVSI